MDITFQKPKYIYFITLTQTGTPDAQRTGK